MNLNQVSELLTAANQLANTIARIKVDMMSPEEKEAERKRICSYAWEDHEEGNDRG